GVDLRGSAGGAFDLRVRSLRHGERSLEMPLVTLAPEIRTGNSYRDIDSPHSIAGGHRFASQPIAGTGTASRNCNTSSMHWRQPSSVVTSRPRYASEPVRPTRPCTYAFLTSFRSPSRTPTTSP